MKILDVRGHRVPALGFGTFQLEGDACEEGVRHALELGYRHVDTAAFYDNEERVGKALAESGVPREDVWLTTKVWRDDLAPADARRAAEDCLRRLDQEYVDLLLIHWPHDQVPVAQTLEALRGLQEEGKVRSLGVSNFPVALLKEASAVPGVALLTDQVEYHPFLSQQRVHGFLREHDMMLTAYSPLARGEVLEDATLRRIGEKHGKSPAQVALRWLLEQDRVAVIPKASSASHREQNLQVFDFELDDDDTAAIDALPKDRRQISPSFAPEWDPA